MHNTTHCFSFIGLLWVGLSISSCHYQPKKNTDNTQPKISAPTKVIPKFSRSYASFTEMSNLSYLYIPTDSAEYIHKNKVLDALIGPAALMLEKKELFVQKPIQWRFSLQIASVNKKSNLMTTLASLKSKAPNLFQGSVIANVETALVKNTNVYRLKFGAYKYYKNALADCQTFKHYQVDCLVSNYTNKPFDYQSK
ncbi:SPOR domain-containing protein [Pseudoalteromonas sp. Ld20]|uniref:SPOR domain-containing protein n=1 Tax=Pseudoalteromonas sp. Ld20 TaxID=649165 RepID=UPI00386A0335